MRHIYFIAEIINAGTAQEWLLTCEVYSEFIIILIQEWQKHNTFIEPFAGLSVMQVFSNNKLVTSCNKLV